MHIPRQLLSDTAIGAGLAAVVVMTLLGFDILNLGTMVLQTQHSALFLALMFFKPMLVFGSCAAGWSVLRRPLAVAEAREPESQSEHAPQRLAFGNA